MKTSELHYDLPPELIAQHPCATRDQSRLLIVNRGSGKILVDTFMNLPGYLRAGDCLVLNDTKVIRARLRAVKATGGKVEIFLLHETAPGVWSALVRPSARVAPNTRVVIGGVVEAVIGQVLPQGQREVFFDAPNVLEILEQIGEIPLPPYIHRDQQDKSDLSRYQTIYARSPGAVAAPTAGLHYSEKMLEQLRGMGVHFATLTLHVGYGTFKPIQVDEVERHVVDPEEFVLPEESARLLNETRAQGGRIVAVGTTVTRVLETRFVDGQFQPGAGQTRLFIYPPYAFKAVDALQTNFHLPQSSLLALVCAFAGTELIIKAYERAVAERFRFYSYGDTMLIC